MNITREFLERIYDRYNRREYVHPDPLEFLYGYEDPADREIVGLVASSLAYGNVKVILKSVSRVLEPMGSSPASFLARTDPRELLDIYADFRHRFTTGEEMASFLWGIRSTVERYGSLGAFVERSHHGDMVRTQAALVSEILAAAGVSSSSLLPDPVKGSASKRLNLYFRWMVRRDDVDPGGWNLPPADLLIPLDTHMHAFARAHAITRRASGNLRTVQEITNFFRTLEPDDPVKYDFVITRPGISGLVYDV